VSTPVNDVSGSITEVKDLTGDSSVSQVRGKKCFIFDITCNLEFDITDEADEKIGKGKIVLPDISSTAAEDGEWEHRVEMKKGAGDAKVKAEVEKLVANVKTALDGFVRTFNAEYA
jgi:activator of HSP90 ATPase